MEQVWDSFDQQEVHHQACSLAQEGGEETKAKEISDQKGDGADHPFRCPEQEHHLLAYFTRGEDENEDPSDKAYVKVKFGPEKMAQALIDSGNMVASAINEQLLQQLGLPLQPYDGAGGPAAVAPDGRRLEIVGQTPDLQFTFDGAPNTTFSETMVVIKNLSHQMNLGKAWLSKHRAVHDHGKESVRLKRPQQSGWTTIRLRGLQEEVEDTAQRFVYGQMRTRIPAKSARYIPVSIPALKHDMDVLITPVEGTSNPGLLAKSLSRVKEGRTMAAIFNPLDKAVYLDRWIKLGVAEELEPEKVLGNISPGQGQSQPNISAEEENRRRSWLRDEFRLKDSDVLQGDPKTMRKLEDLLLEYFDIISVHKTDYGRTDMLEMEIDLVPGAKPYKGRCLPINPAEEADLLKTLEDWNRQGVIEPANSPWGAPLIPVRKKDGRLRWCVDFRKLNEMTVKDSFPLPLITTNLHKLGNSTIFSTIDGTGAYHNVKISERDRPLTAFVSPFGQFQFLRMPFGLTNAPPIYSRLVQMLLQGCDVRHILAYIDDIIAHTSSKEEHLRILRQIFEAHRKGGLKIAPAKTFLFRSKVDYLGHQVSRDGIEMVPSYVDLLLKWPKPTTPKELATFLGKSGYYRAFIKDYGKIVACLEAEKKKPSLVWTPQMDKAFEVIKTAFSSKPILGYPDYPGIHEGRPFILDSDWSKEGMAQQISQLQPGPDGLRERVIANKGRKCTQAERNYSSNKGETASFVDGLEGFEHMLRYAPFKARVDNRCLSYIRNLKKPTGIWWRWLEFIQSFHFDITHRAGKKHGNVDALSRAPHLPDPTEEQERISSSYFCTMTKNQLDKVEELNQATLNEMEADGEPEAVKRDVTLPLTNQQIRQAQEDDPTVRSMINWVRRGVKPSKDERRLESLEVQQMVQDFEMYYLHNQILYRRILENEPKVGEQERLVLPRSLRETAFYWAHSHSSAGHMGMKVTQNRMRSRFYFSGLYNWVERMVLGCHACIKKRGPTRASVTPKNIQRGYPGARWSLDLVGPLPESGKGNVYIMTAEENFCRWPIAVGIPDKRAETVAKAFEQHVLAEHGSCQQLLTDNAQELTGNIIADVAKILGISKVTTVPYNPNGNIVERWHRTLGMMLRTMVDKDQRNWDDCLSACLLAYRTSVHATTKMTPYFLMHGREAILPIDLIFARPPQQYEVATEFGKDMTDRLDAAFKFVRENQKKVIKRQVATVEGQTKEATLQVGDLVWYYSPRQTVGQARKLHQGWTGPFQVQNAVSEVMYVITPHGDWTDKRPLIPAVIHRLRRYHKDTAEATPKTNATEEELVEDLIDKVDENLEASDEIYIEVCPEQHPQEMIKVQIPISEEVEDIEDIVTRRNKAGGGRPAVIMTAAPAPAPAAVAETENLGQDLKDFFGMDRDDDEKMEDQDDVRKTDNSDDKKMEGQDDAADRKEMTESNVTTSDNNVTVTKDRNADDGQGNVTMLVQKFEANSSKQVRDKEQTENAAGRVVESTSRPKAQVREQRAPTRRSQRTHVARAGPFAPTQQVRNVDNRAAYKTASTQPAGPANPGAPTPVPSYMATAAHGAAVTPEGSTKRAREEDTESVGSQKSAKQFDFEWARGFNSMSRMTDAMAHCHISIGSTTEDTGTRSRRNGGPTERARRQPSPPRRWLEIPYHRIVLSRGGKMPVRGSINAAGYDCFALKEFRIAKGQTAAVSLGFHLAPSGGVYCRLAETSSWPYEKPMFLLRAGVIDPDYRGQVSALITYLGPDEFGYINKGERVCQLIPTCFRCDPFHVCSTLPRSGRGASAGYTRFLDEDTVLSDRDGRPVRGRPDGTMGVPDYMEADWIPMPVPEDQRSLGAESSKSPSPDATENARMDAGDRDTPPPVSGPPITDNNCTN